jgi:hypothetical protein
VTVSAVMARGAGPNNMTAKKIWHPNPLLYSLLNAMSSVCHRGGRVWYTCINRGGGGVQTKEVES